MRNNWHIVPHRSPNWPLALVAFVQNAPGENTGERITHGLKTLIVTGTLLPGDRLPSARELSRILGVHQNTVHKAFGRLVSDGILRTASTTGTFVARRDPSGSGGFEVTRRFDDTLSRVAVEAKVHGVTLDQLRAALSRCWRQTL